MIASTKKKEKKISADPKVHFKMYKGGKLWLVSGLSMLSVTGTLMASKAVTVHADTTSSTNGGTQAVASGGNAVSKTNASYTQVNVDSSALTSAVSAAKSAGVNVSSASGSSYTVQGSAQLSSAEATVKSDYASQTQALQSAAAIAQNSNAVSSAVTSANAAVTSAASAYQAAGGQVANPSYTSVSAQTSSAASSQVASIKAAASSTVAVLSNATETKKAVNSGNNAIQSAANAAADVPGLQLTSASNQKVDTASEASSVASDQVKAINDAIATQKQYDQEYAEEVQNIRNKQVDATTPDGSGTVTSGNWVNFVPKKLGPLTISGTGSIRSVADLQNGNYQIVAYNPDSNLDKSHIITHVVWGNIAPQLISGSLEAGNGPDNTYSTPGTEVWHVTSGSVIRIPQSLYTMDGTVHDVIIKIESGGDALSNNIVTIWNQNNAINYTQVGNGNTKNNNYITVSYGVDTLDNSEPYLWLNAEADLDVQQRITVGGGDNVQTLSVGGNLQYDATNGYAKVKSLPGADLSGFDSAPDGIVVYAAYATNLVKTISDDGSPQAYAIADADFGISLDLNYVEHKATSVSYHYLVSRNDGSYLKYTLYKNDSTGASVSYHTDTIYYTQTGEKQSTETVGGAVTTIDGKQVVKGDTVNYTISTDNLPANRTTDTTNVTFTDTLPTGVALKDSKIMLGNQDVTSWFTKSVSGQTVTYTLTNADVLKQINSTKSTAFTMPKMVISGVVTLDGATLKNTAHVLLNNANVSTNTTTSTSGTTTPTKRATVDNDSASADNKYVVPGDTINYTVNWDLTGLPKSTVVSDSIVAKGLSLTDNYDGQTTADQRSLTVVDANGNVVSGISTSWDANNHVLKITANNPRQFIATYGGQKLQVKFNATVNKNLKDGSVISNTAIQNNFGSDYKTNTVTEKVQNPDPTKDVVKNAGSTVSIDGKTVPFGSNVSWKLNSTTLKAGRATVMTSWGATDVLDLSHVTPTGNWKVYTNTAITIDGTKYVAGSDVSQYFVYTYDAKTGTAKLAANAKYLAAVNASKDTAQSWSGYIQTTATKAGWATNTFDETLNTNDTKSNEVKTFTYDPVIPDPNKDATIGKNDGSATTSINGKQVTKGDTIAYELKGQTLKQYHDTIESFADTDVFDKGVTYIGYIAYMQNADGTKTDVTSHMKEQVNGDTVKWVADDTLLKMMNSDTYNTKASVTPTVVAYAVVNTDEATKIDNTYNLLINGKTDVSNIVEVTPTKDTPSKSETVAGNDSNGKTVIANDTINYDVTWDLSGLDMSKTAISNTQLAKGISLTDSMTATEGTIGFVSAKNLVLKTADGKTVDPNLYTVSGPSTIDFNGLSMMTVKIQAKDAKTFLNTYGGQKLHLMYAVTVKDGKSGDIENKAVQSDFGNTYNTNVVKNVITDINPTKDVVVNAGETTSINGNTVDKESTYNYKLNSSVLPANRATIVGTWSATDKLDLAHVTPTGNWKVYTDTDFVAADGSTVKAGTDISEYFTYNYTNGTVTMTPKASYLQVMNSAANRATKQSWSGYVQVKVTAAGWATNTFDEDLNNVTDKSNEVKTFSFDPVIPDANKDVTVGKNDGSDTVSINGKQVTKGDTVSFELKGQPLVQYHEKINDFAAVDIFDKGLTYVGYIAYMQNANGTKTDVTSHIKEQVDGNTVKYVADDYLKSLMNSDVYNTKASVTPTIIAYATVNTDQATKIDNTYTLNINGKTDVSNIVEVTPTKDTPSKSETVAGNDSNNKTVIANDTINYDVTWDLSGLDMSKTAISSQQLAKGISLTDTMTATDGTLTGNVTAKDLVLKTAAGKTVDSNLYTVSGPTSTTKNGITTTTFTIKAKDAKTFLNTYGGQKLHLTYAVTVKDGKSGNIANQAVQSDFGNIYSTNVVKNVITDINPTKDVVVNAGETKSIDGSTVAKESTYNYKLNSSVLPANRATIVGTWTATDKLDTAHVAATGNWKVYTDTDFVDASGNTVKAGTDISKYFSFNNNNGTVTFTPNADYKALMNSTANRNTKQQWSGYVQVKVIAAGWATNTFDEDLNNITDKSNEVKTFSFDPVIPDPNKDVKIGETNDSKAGSVNGKQVTKGDTVSFELKGQPLVQYHETVKTFNVKDTLDDGLEYEGYTASMMVNGKQTDVTAHLKLQQTGNVVEFTADDYLKSLMNSDAYNTKASETPTIYLYAKVAKDDVTIDNTYTLNINGKTDVSNIVEVTTKGSNPSKTVNIDDTTTDGNGKVVLANDKLAYTVTWDLSNLNPKNLAISSTQLAKGLSLTDTLTYSNGAVTAPTAKDFSLVDANGKAVDSSLYKLVVGQATTKDGVTTLPITITATDANKFLQSFGGQKLQLKYNLTVLKDKTGSVKNSASQNNFGQSYDTKVVTNTVENPQPSKDVVKDAGSTVSIDGQTVGMGDTINYVLKSRTLPANRGTVVGDWSVSDVLSKKVQATGQWKAVTQYDLTLADGSVLKAGSDISKYFTVSFNNGTVVATPTAEFLKIANLQANQAKQLQWKIYVPTKVVASGWATNQFNEDMNKVTEDSNEVKTFTFEPVNPDPNKDVNLGEESTSDAANATSINGDLVTVGDTLTYQLKGQTLPQYHDQIKTFSATDTFDSAVSYLGYKAYMTDENGKQVDVTDYLTATVDGNKVTWTAKDALLKLMNSDEYNTKASDTPTILAYVKVNKSASKIANKYTLDINGKTDISNEVDNNTPEDPTPTKHNTVDGIQIDGKTVAAGTTSDYLINWDLDQYKGAVASTNQINRGFYVVDDYPDDVLTPDLSKFTVKAGNTTITGVSAKEYSSLADAPLALQLALKEKGITPSGKFIVFSADDPASFFKNYVQTGTNLTIDLQATVKATTAAKTSYTNTAYQSDFGNVSTQATVTNQTPDNPTPTKVDDNEAGVDINGKTVLPGSTNVYKLTLDYDQYKGMAASDDIVANGFYMIEDYPEEALDVDTSKFTMQDANGKAVTGLSAKVYQSVSDAPAAVQAVIKANNLKINGAFIVFSADNPAQFFKDYVQTGDSITIAAPMTVKDTATDGESYSNVAYQVDFGKAFETNVVTNNVTKPNPKKDVVLSVDNNKSLDNSNISLNQSFDYELEGADLPEGLGTPLTQYGFVDDYDQVHDQYNGQYLVMAKRDIYLTDGTVLKKGTDLTKYTTQTIDTENGKVDIEFSKDFLAKVDFTKGGFKADAYVSMTRVKAGDVTNQYTNVINGKDYLSNTVKTHTDEPKQPETPTTPTTPETPATPETPQSTTPEVPQSTTPATPQSATPAAVTPTTPAATPTPVSAPAAKVESPATPAQKQASLPQTGNDDKAKGAMLLGLGGLLMSFGLLGSKKKKAN